MRNLLNKKKETFSPLVEPKDAKTTNYLGVASIVVLMFAIGIGWYIPGGIAGALEATFTPGSVTQSNVNLSLTIYLVGLMVGAPSVSILFYKIKRKYIVLSAVIIYIITNLIIGFSFNFSELLALRFFSGLAHGTIIAIATLMAAAMVPPAKRGVTIAICYSALFASTFTLVPAFTFWSQQGWSVSDPSSLYTLPLLKQNWRWSFVITAIISIIALFLIIISIPKDMHLAGDRNLKKELGTLIFWPFVLEMLFTFFIFITIFIIYPLLQKLWIATDGYGIIEKTPQLLALLLAVYGIASMVGNQCGGIFANGKTYPWIYILIIALIINIILLIISCVFKVGIAIFIFTITLPIIAYMILPNIYAVGLALAKYHDKSESVDFESGIIGFMIGLGGMVGTAIGGPIVSNKQGDFLPENFNIICYICIGVLLISLVILFPIHWYLTSARLTINQHKMFINIFNITPVLIDKYITNDIENQILKDKETNHRLKIIDTRKKQHKNSTKNKNQ